METTTLIKDIIKANTIYFRDIKIGSLMELVLEKEGTPTEIKEYSNPFYHYFFEIGEMEELNIYYNYEKSKKSVNEIRLHFIHYPEYYWKKEGNTDPIEFWNLLNKNQLQPFSKVFLNTVQDVLSFFSTLLNKEPTLLTKPNAPFDAPHNDYKVYKWTVDSITI